MLIVFKSVHEVYKCLLCYILTKWCYWVTDMINCRDAIASKKPRFNEIAQLEKVVYISKVQNSLPKQIANETDFNHYIHKYMGQA